jgi:hypothetical protein
VALPSTGWNLVAYPVQGDPTVADGLASIAGSYKLVYGYDHGDSNDPWKVYAPDGVPAWVNDLTRLHFNQIYWISTTHPITLYASGGNSGQERETSNEFVPPATYYGQVLAGDGFTPAAGQTVQAMVNGVVCGTGQTQQEEGQIVYTINVFGAEPGQSSCGQSGSAVRFSVAGLPVQTTATWQNDAIVALDLRPGTLPESIYLPLVVK